MDTQPHVRCRARRQRVASHHRRRGVGYVYFLSTMMLIAVIGVSALMAARIQLRTAGGTNDSTAARLYAQSAIELGLLMIRDNPQWWITLGTGTWLADTAIGDGTFSLEVILAPAGDEQDDGADPALLIGTGTRGQAQHRTEVTVAPISAKGGFAISPGSWQRNAG